MRFHLLMVLVISLSSQYSQAEISQNNQKMSLTDIFRNCISQSVKDGEVQFKKPDTGQSFLFLTCKSSAAKRLYMAVEDYQIHS